MKLGRYLIGLVSGLTFGMLFAPKKGTKLRDELLKKRDVSGEAALRALFDAFKEAGTDAAGEMKKLSENEQVQAALNMSKDRMRSYLDDIQDTGYDIAARVQDKAEELGDMATELGTEFKTRAMKHQKAVKRAVRKNVKKGAKTVKKGAKTVKSKAEKVEKAASKKPGKRRAKKTIKGKTTQEKTSSSKK